MKRFAVLNRTGKVKVKLKAEVSYTPTAGDAAAQTKKLTLKKR